MSSSPPPLGLTRDRGHRYTWSDGDAVVANLPSVTTILSVIDRSGPLVGWAKRETAACAVRNLEMLTEMKRTGGDAAAVAWLKGIPDFQRDSAANLGSRVHLLAEQIARGGPVEPSADEAPFVTAYRAFLDDVRPKFLAVEEMVCSLRHKFAGTLDAIAVLDGETWLLDIKTGAGVYAEAGLQLAGYASADFIGRPATSRRFRIPLADRFGVVHVRPEGVRLIEYHVDPGTRTAFLEARRLFAWKEGPARMMVGQPVAARNDKDAA